MESQAAAGPHAAAARRQEAAALRMAIGADFGQWRDGQEIEPVHIGGTTSPGDGRSSVAASAFSGNAVMSSPSVSVLPSHASSDAWPGAERMKGTRAESPGGLQRPQYARARVSRSRISEPRLRTCLTCRAARPDDFRLTIRSQPPNAPPVPAHPYSLTIPGTPPKLHQTGGPRHVRRVIRVTETIVCYRINLPLSSRP